MTLSKLMTPLKLFCSTPPALVSNSIAILTLPDIEKSEGVFTNRAMAHIKLAKYKEALYDCEQALVLNPNFAKAHLRSFTCYT